MVAAGGVASLDDLERLRDLGCEGAIGGSALWSGRIRLGDALQRVKSEPPKSEVLAPYIAMLPDCPSPSPPLQEGLPPTCA